MMGGRGVSLLHVSLREVHGGWLMCGYLCG